MYNKIKKIKINTFFTQCKIYLRELLLATQKEVNQNPDGFRKY